MRFFGRHLDRKDTTILVSIIIAAILIFPFIIPMIFSPIYGMKTGRISLVWEGENCKVKLQTWRSTEVFEGKTWSETASVGPGLTGVVGCIGETVNPIFPMPEVTIFLKTGIDEDTNQPKLTEYWIRASAFNELWPFGYKLVSSNITLNKWLEIKAFNATTTDPWKVNTILEGWLVPTWNISL